MDGISKNHHDRVKITDLIAEAVSNAEARRYQITDVEASLSDAEAATFKGGLSVPVKPIILGRMSCPPITVGLIALPTETSIS